MRRRFGQCVVQETDDRFPMSLAQFVNDFIPDVANPSEHSASIPYYGGVQRQLAGFKLIQEALAAIPGSAVEMKVVSGHVSKDWNLPVVQYKDTVSGLEITARDNLVIDLVLSVNSPTAIQSQRTIQEILAAENTGSFEGFPAAMAFKERHAVNPNRFSVRLNSGEVLKARDFVSAVSNQVPAVKPAGLDLTQ
ncbi:MAG: hypothetical protein IT558_03990 [Alphaproteobacteria bacterium]|nr:hypothetical protein [Alphaproteobacteria bacterium]